MHPKCSNVCQSVKNTGTRRCALLFNAGVIRAATLTEGRFDFMSNDDYAGTNCNVNFVLPKREYRVRPVG